MAYHFERDDASIRDGVRRIAIEQIDKAISEVDSRSIDVQETAHQVRKRCKKLRGLIRLVRPVFANYKAENASFRDAAKSLAFIRDTQAQKDAYDAVVGSYHEEIDRRAFAPIRRHFTLQQKDRGQRQDIERTLAAFRDAMVSARRRARTWHLSGDEFDGIAQGLRKTYKRAQRAMWQVEEGSSSDAIHEWRKRVKDHWYHARLLSQAWPGPMKAHRNAAETLSNLLGTHHDLSVFEQTLSSDPQRFGESEKVEVFICLIARRQAELEDEALAAGARLLAEPPPALAQRWETYWSIWREEGAFRTEARAA
jgi:CHAD domain-containing protein